MTIGQSQRLQRNFHNLPPSKFHAFNQRTKTCLSDKTRFPDSLWGNNLPMVQKYFTVSDKHDGAYHESLLGSKVVIMEREGLQAQLVMYLDQIAALLEMMAVVNPDILIASGFDLTKDRRGRARTNATAAARSAAGTEQADGESGA